MSILYVCMSLLSVSHAIYGFNKWRNIDPHVHDYAHIKEEFNEEKFIHMFAQLGFVLINLNLILDTMVRLGTQTFSVSYLVHRAGRSGIYAWLLYSLPESQLQVTHLLFAAWSASDIFWYQPFSKYMHYVTPVVSTPLIVSLEMDALMMVSTPMVYVVTFGLLVTAMYMESIGKMERKYGKSLAYYIVPAIMLTIRKQVIKQ